ncbi:hypothetical protein P344_02310 [Spiroplasma mirum ATCC 29335]|uniref:Lipoprotein n=1 Tax=Spiroplasma mirum ATCC 29335 TaxID=838561 RepID=W6AVR9_9MOLU|nr:MULTISPECIES: lipoprotein [Spiroplasma]AHI57809.1 hypothetical protein P344_02310 [Spiroplasma mirum ATCC 29335]AKM52942.1 hypothetical protein SATRI_v1c04390 [Spiroplasma atrichopogonis]
MRKLLAILGSLNIILTSNFTVTSCDIFIDKNNTPT